jgi:hypothetical protein
MLTECGFVSNRPSEFTYLAPLYLHPDYTNGNGGNGHKNGTMFDDGRTENLQPAFRKWLNSHYAKVFSAEQIAGYIYAVLHSQSYRQRYYALLCMDYPRIPFVQEPATFEALATLGWEMLQVHTLQTEPKGTVRTLLGEGSGTVDAYTYNPKEKRLYLNATQYYCDVKPEVWEYTVGGYQVLKQYLKARKDTVRSLSLQELRHLPRLVNLIEWTFGQIDAIDALLPLPLAEHVAEA